VEIQELRFGVEIETIRRSRGNVARAIQTVVGGNVEHVGSPTCYDPWHVVDERSRPKTREQMNRIWYGYHNHHPQHYDQTRYHGVNLHNVWYRGNVEFRWFQATLHAGKVKAAVQFVLAIAAKALNSRGASSRKREFDPASAKYDFRVFLLHLGLIGDEFKSARKHLLNAMPGDAAWKNGRPKPKNLKPAVEISEWAMERTKVRVPADVLEGLEAVRLSGKTNMLDAPRVIELAFETEHYATALWVHENRGLYSQGIFRGFAAAALPNNCGSSRHVAQHGASSRTVGKPSDECDPGDSCEGGENPCVDSRGHIRNQAPHSR